MDYEAILNDLAQDTNPNQNHLKIAFLYQEKERLETLVRTLKTNNTTLRNLNDSAPENISFQLQELLLQNQKLERDNFHLSEIQSDLKTEIFLNKQVFQQNQKQFLQITKNYQEKILELRKSTQTKECIIHQYERKLTIDPYVEEIKITPYHISLKFYAEFQEYREIINETIKKNKKLEKQMAQLKRFTEISTPQITKNSPTSQKMELSKKIEESTKNISQDNIDKSINQLSMKKLNKKLYIENLQLKKNLRSLKKKYEQERNKTTHLIQANKFYQQRRQKLIHDLTHLKNINHSLSEALKKKGNFKENSHPLPEDIQVSRLDSKYWKKVSEEIEEKLSSDLNKIKRGRSQSFCQEMLIDKQCQAEQKIEKSKVQPVNELTFEGISIIGGSMIQKHQRKKTQNLNEMDIMLDDSFLD